MGLFDWLRGGRPELKTARWMREQIATAVNTGDAVALATACAALAGHGAMVFGMVRSDFAGRAKIADEALDALRGLIANVPSSQCAQLFHVVTRADLPIDVTERRRRWEIECRELADQMLGEKRAQLASCDARTLVEACAALRRHSPIVLGMSTRDLDDEREPMLATALERLRALIPTLPDDECREVLAQIREARLPIDTAARSAELAEQRRAELADAIAQAADKEPRNTELERVIDEHPEDASAYSVLADWLIEQGHPRGGLIALQLRAEAEPSLSAAADAHLDAHASALLGPLAAHRHTHDGESRDAFTWRRGFIERARLSCANNRANGHTLADMLELLLAHPSGRWLAALDLGVNGYADDDTLDEPLGVLWRRRPSSLRELGLGADIPYEQCMISSYRIGDLSPLWRALPELRTLFVRGAELVLGTVEHEWLERVEVQTAGLSAACARAIASAKLPRLRHLDVWYGDPDDRGEATIAEVEPLLARIDLAHLDHLGLKNAAFTDAICAALPSSALAGQLRELDLSMGTMSEIGARALAARPDAFPKLVGLDVSDNYLDEAAVAALRHTFPGLLSGAQRTEDDGDPDERYPSVGE